METIFRWSSHRPITALLLALLLCLALSAGITRLRIDGSFEHLLSESDSRVVHLRQVRENFGDRPVLLLLAESPDLFERATLEGLKSLSEELASVEGVVGRSDVFSTAVPVNRGDLIHAAPLLEPFPETDEALAAARGAILANGLFRDHLVDPRGEAMLLLFFLESEGKGGGNHARILADFERILDSRRAGAPSGQELTLAGMPRLKISLQQHIFRDLTRLAPIALLVIGALIYYFFRSPAAVVLPLLTGSISSIATLGFMGFAGMKSASSFSTILVLILVLGCTEDLHILSEYLDNLERGVEKREAIVRTGATTGKALLLCSATTVLGFLSVLFTGITGMRHFAASSAFGLSFNFLVTILVLPALLALLPAPKRTSLPDTALLQRIGRWLEAGFLRHRGFMASISLVILAVSGLGMAGLVTNTDYLRFFSKDSEEVRAHRRFSDAFGGAAHLTVTLETGERHGVIRADRLEQLLRLHDFLDSECGRALSLIDLLNEYGKARGRPAIAPGALPPPADLARFLEQTPRDALKPFVDYDGSRAAIRLRVHAPTSSDALDLERRILDFTRSRFGPESKVEVTGDLLVTAHLCEIVTNQLVRNLVILALVVAGLISLIVRSLRQGLLAIIPNLFPIFTTFGAMGWLGIPLSAATFPVANIAFGIAVDDTIHFLLRFNARRRLGDSPEGAILSTLRTELRPIVATSVTVAGGYLVMAASPLRSNAEVGFLFALATFSALLADLVLTPVLLRNFAVNTRASARSPESRPSRGAGPRKS